jgi:uncharacterized membrane protein
MIYNWHRKQRETLTHGERAADILRNGMGSWPFVFGFLIFMGLWALANTIVPIMHWDGYPFILLNLFLSMLAGLQGAILLIAAKRQDAISAAMAKHDYDTNLRAKREIEELTRLNEQQLQIMQSLHTVLVEKQPRTFTVDFNVLENKSAPSADEKIVKT